jgi:hypothetical protein
MKRSKPVKLSIELVPKTCWFSNVRDHVATESWNIIRFAVYKKAGYECEICGDQGPKWPVECHEVWDYNDDTWIQKLIGFQALCPLCHKVKHIGFAGYSGNAEPAVKHLMKVNRWAPSETKRYLKEVFEIFWNRSTHDWKLDLGLLDQLGVPTFEDERMKK